MSTVGVIVGVVGRAHGTRGDVSVEPRTDEPERRFAPGSLVRAEGEPGSPFTGAGSRWPAGRLFLRSYFSVVDRVEVTGALPAAGTPAEGLRGTALVADVAADERPEDDDEYYDRQLIGLRVLHHTGVKAGRVSEVVHTGAQDLLVVVTTAREERLVPFVSALVPHVDLAAGTCTLADVPGLLVDAEADEATPS